MSSFKEKAQVFIIGLSIGLLIAGAFFILKLDDYFRELNLYKRMSQTFVPARKPEHPEKTATEKENKKTEDKHSKNKSVVITDSVIPAPVVPDLSVVSTDSLRTHTDSSSVDSDDIVVRKDELLATKTIEINNLNPTAKAGSKDSLLQKISGIKDDKFSGKQMFNIELWQSPLNYKGYKLGKYKMVLYGINSFEGLRLYKLDEVIYLKISGIVYRLDYANDFKQYERITDEQIINKLK